MQVLNTQMEVLNTQIQVLNTQMEVAARRKMNEVRWEERHRRRRSRYSCTV